MSTVDRGTLHRDSRTNTDERRQRAPIPFAQTKLASACPPRVKLVVSAALSEKADLNPCAVMARFMRRSIVRKTMFDSGLAGWSGLR